MTCKCEEEDLCLKSWNNVEDLIKHLDSDDPNDDCDTCNCECNCGREDNK